MHVLLSDRKRSIRSVTENDPPAVDAIESEQGLLVPELSGFRTESGTELVSVEIAQ